MKADTQLILGPLTFRRFEVPESISFGGDQALAVHELVGGKRVVDAMGRQDKPLEWSGVFIGDDAEQRANYLNFLRISGKPAPLTWAAFNYNVIVKSVSLEYRRAYEIPYKISCVVIEDLSVPFITAASDGTDYTITADCAAANSLCGLIGDGPLSGLMATLSTAIGAVSSFATAAQSTINSVLTPLAAVKARVGLLISSVGNTVSNVGSLGGILPNSPIATQASNLAGQVSAMTELPQLYNLNSVLGRMQGNLGSVVSSGQSVTVAGGDMFTLASKNYGDASAWTTIASANKLVDPVLTGIQTVKIPSVQDFSGGVFKI